MTKPPEKMVYTRQFGSHRNGIELYYEVQEEKVENENVAE